MPSLFGLMPARGSRWVIKSYLYRHAPMFELLIVLDGSPRNSIDAQWTLRQCALYNNVRYAHEEDANLTKVRPTDQTTRSAATRVLLQALAITESELEGRWLFLAHPDEFFVQDLRDLVAGIEQRDSFATIVLFDILYAMPTRGEWDSIIAHHGRNSTGFESFNPMEHLEHCDGNFPFREPRLFKWTRGTSWGRRHGITTPQVHPGRRPWPTARESALHHAPFYIHYKVHDFGLDAFEVKSDREHGGAWISFRSSGFDTGLARHRAHGAAFHVSASDDASDQIASYYQKSGRIANSLRSEIRKRCSVPGIVARCSVPWRTSARFVFRTS